MAISLGQYLRGRYGKFIPDQLDRSKFRSRSTDFERTIVTAVGVLRGLFPNVTRDIPYITHEMSDVDLDLGYYYSWPSADLRKDWFDGWDDRYDAITRTMVSQENLTTIGRVLGVEQICQNHPTLCALLGEDIATCRRSNGGEDAELLVSMLPQLFRVQEASNNFLYMYDPSERFWKNTGPYGIRIAAKIVKQFQEALQWNAKTPQERATLDTPPVVYHYSAHDVTVYGLFSALGVINSSTTGETMLIPTFTATVLFELYDDATVEIVYARCNQDLNSGYAFYEVPKALVKLACVRADHSIYYSHTCPIDDLARYVNMINGVSPQQDPPCYADPSDVSRTMCSPELDTNVSTIAAIEKDSAYAKTPAGQAEISALKNCLQYRRHCMAEACNAQLVVSEPPTNQTAPSAGYIYNMSVESCVPRTTSTEAAKPVAIFGRVVVAAACAILGFLIGVFIEMCRDQWKRTHPEVALDAGGKKSDREDVEASLPQAKYDSA